MRPEQNPLLRRQGRPVSLLHEKLHQAIYTADLLEQRLLERQEKRGWAQGIPLWESGKDYTSVAARGIVETSCMPWFPRPNPGDAVALESISSLASLCKATEARIYDLSVRTEKQQKNINASLPLFS